MESTPLSRCLKEFERIVTFEPGDELTVDLALLSAVAAKHPRFPENVWYHIIGPPSSGKTESVLPLRGHKDYVFMDTLTTNAFVSGYRGEDGKQDFSILKQVINKTLIIKDLASMRGPGDVILMKFQNELRSAYDGSYGKASGMDGLTEYVGRFGVIICATEAYEELRKKLPSLGERFVGIKIARFPLTSDYSINKSTNMMMDLLNPNMPTKSVRRDRLAGVMQEEVDKLVTWALTSPVVELSRDMGDKISRCGWILTQARTPPLTDGTLSNSEREWRVAQVFMSVALSHAMICGRTKVTEDDMEMVRRLTVDTLDLQRSRLLQHLYKMGGKHKVKRPLEAIASFFEMSIRDLRVILKQWRSLGIIDMDVDKDERVYVALSQEFMEHLMVTDLFNKRNVDFNKV